MGRTDKEMGWKRHRIFLPTSQWKGTPPTQTQVTGIPVYGVKQTATGLTSEGAIKVPPQWDPNQDLGFKVNFVEDGATATAVTSALYTVKADLVDASGALLTQSATVLDTILTATTIASAAATPKSNWTSRGIKNKGWSTRAKIHAGQWLQFSVTLTTAANIASTDFLVCLGLEIDFVPMFTIFPHSELDRPLDDSVS